MAEKQGAGWDEDTVELEFTQRHEDMAEAVRLVLRKRGAVARLLYHPASLACVVLAGVAFLVLGAWYGEKVGMACGGGLTAWAVAMLLAPRSMARGMMKANGHHGLTRITVGPEGVCTVSEHGDLRMGWAGFGSYAESDRVFVLRSPDRAGNGALVLVKQGARSARDVDRLRALLDRHLPRV